MAHDLYRLEPGFRCDVDTCAEILEPRLGFDLRDVLYPRSSHDEAEASDKLGETSVTQPALFVIEYALAKLWMAWGVRPRAFLGHSVGEYVAATLSGVFTLEDALSLVAARGRAMQAAPRGGMLAVAEPAEAVQARVDESRGALCLAAVNAEELSVVSGPVERLSALEARLRQDGIECKRLRVSHAFHSSMMEPALEELGRELEGVTLNEPELPIVSNVTGRFLEPSEARDPDYWKRQLRETVRFHEGLRTLLRSLDGIVLEVGPGRGLSALAKRHPDRTEAHEIIASLPSPDASEGARESCLAAAGAFWLAGVELDWRALHRGRRRVRVALPTYPFERERFWADASGSAVAPAALALALAPHREREDEDPRKIEDWFYVPSWKRAAAPVAPERASAARVLVLSDTLGLGRAVGEALSLDGHSVFFAEAASHFAAETENRFCIRPGAHDDYRRLLAELSEPGEPGEPGKDTDGGTPLPIRILHFWGLKEGGGARAFESLVALGGALAENGSLTAEITIVTTGVYDVLGSEALEPERSVVLGPLNVMPQELPGLRCRHVDVDFVLAHGEELRGLVRELLSPAGKGGRIVAYRNGRRWVPAYDALPLGPAGTPPRRLRERGVYLVTGGLGHIGLRIALFLARTVRARLVLVTRGTFPARSEWRERMEATAPTDPMAYRLARLLEVEARGGEVEIVTADVTRADAMGIAIEKTLERFGRLDGVFHAAGAPKLEGPVATTTFEESVQQFAPRLPALEALHRALGRRELDFVCVTSSLASLLGATGFVAYTAAHAAMDAFVDARNRDGAVPWVGVNWDNWGSDEGSVSGSGIPTMSPERAVDALGRILDAEISGRVVVSTTELHSRMDRWLDPDGARASALERSKESNESSRPELSTDYVAPRSDLEKVLAAIWSDLLGVDEVGAHDNFFELGGDSVVGIQLVARAKAKGIRVRARDVFVHPTVSKLAASLQTGAAKATVPVPEAIDLDGPVPMLPIQRWFFEQRLEARDHFNHAVMVEPATRLEPEPLDGAWRSLFEHHDSLRLRAISGESVQELELAPLGAGPGPVRWVDVSAGDEAAMVEIEASRLHRSLRIDEYPLGRAAYFDRGPGKAGALLFVFHHLVVDAGSWRVLLEDFQTAYRALVRGERPALPEKTTPVSLWARRLRELAQTREIQADVSYWAGRSEKEKSVLPVPALPLDAGDEDACDANREQTVEHVVLRLERERTETLLTGLSRVHGVHAHEALVAALAHGLAAWSGSERVAIDVEGHGRDIPGAEDLDLSRTVGWLTNLYPVILELEPGAGPVESALSVQRQLRAVPRDGMSYGLLRYLADDPSIRHRMEALPRPEVSFLYLGRFDDSSRSEPEPGAAFLRPSGLPAGAPRAPSERRFHLLDVSGVVTRGSLQMRFSYSGRLHRRSTIDALVADFSRALEAVLDSVTDTARATSSVEPEDAGPGKGPGRFPGAKLNEVELQAFLARVRRKADET